MIKQTPFFSIITVSFNSVSTIEQTMLSVLRQKCPDFEYIIIDGGSKDGTLEIIKRYDKIFAENNLQFTFISEPDKGIYDAMNKGLKLSSGVWIGIINSDDYYELDTTMLIKDYIASHPDKELVHGNLRFLENENTSHVEKPNLNLSLLAQTMTVYHPTIFVSREAYKRFGNFDLKYRLCADWELVLRLFKAGIQFGYLDAVLANFRLGGAGSGFKPIHIKERFLIRHLYTRQLIHFMDLKDLLIFCYFKLKPQKH
jgi:glycosyltransferase involved in cell wall biosynthesis